MLNEVKRINVLWQWCVHILSLVFDSAIVICLSTWNLRSCSYILLSKFLPEVWLKYYFFFYRMNFFSSDLHPGVTYCLKNMALAIIYVRNCSYRWIDGTCVTHRSAHIQDMEAYVVSWVNHDAFMRRWQKNRLQWGIHPCKSLDPLT